MTHPFIETFGIVPSLEVLPLFESRFHTPGGESELPFRFSARSSYGGIARDLLTGVLSGGVIPWEIFTADVLGLPGQRTRWTVPVFLQACPTELVLREPVHRAIYPSPRSSKAKTPARLTIGIESRNSLTIHQFKAWLATWKNAGTPEIHFKMLPMDLMIQGMEAEVLDGFIAPSPWGMLAEELGHGKIDPKFDPGEQAQDLVIVTRRDLSRPLSHLITSLALSRNSLRETLSFRKAVREMARAGKPALKVELLEKAANKHASLESSLDLFASADAIRNALERLESFGLLPPPIAASEQTSRLLLV